MADRGVAVRVDEAGVHITGAGPAGSQVTWCGGTRTETSLEG